MPKAILEFNLNDPDDIDDYKLHTKARAMSAALFDIEMMLRQIWKYEELDAKETDLINRIRNEFYAICEDREVEPS